jgi:Flp pilus assembly pilin Flp
MLLNVRRRTSCLEPHPDGLGQRQRTKSERRNAMPQLIVKLQSLVSRAGTDEGATMVEYALIVVAIALVVIAGAYFLGTGISSLFNSIAGAL